MKLGATLEVKLRAILQIEAPEFPPPLVPPSKRWTWEQCSPLETAGLFEIEKLELVNGELLSRMGKKRPHVNARTLLQIWLQKIFGPQFVNVEAPIDVSRADNPTNEPVPNLIVLKRDGATFASGNPQPADIDLVVEISDSTLNFDRSVKAALYARAYILEYWVLDVSGRLLFAHQNSDGSRYSSVIIYGEDESVAPLAAPDAVFCPADVFPV